MNTAIQYLTEAAQSSKALDFILKSFDRSNAPKTALGLYIFYILFKYRDNTIGTRRTSLPGPRGLPLIGNLIMFLRTPGNQISQMHDRCHALYGSTWTFTLPGLGRTIMVNDPAVLEHVLKTNFWAYEKGPIVQESMEDLLGAGIFGADGHQWKWQRKMASHIFNVKAFRDYTSNVFVQESKVVSNYFDTVADKGVVVDIHDILLKFTLDSFGEVSFGKSFGCLANPESEVEFAAAFDRLNAIVSERLFKGPWKLIEPLNGVGRQVAKDKKIIVDFALDIIRNRRISGFDKSQKDLLQLFMDLKDENGEVLSDDMLKDSILNFIMYVSSPLLWLELPYVFCFCTSKQKEMIVDWSFAFFFRSAGRDTTAQALSWMFYLMHRSSTDKNIARKLREEIDTVLGDEMPTYESSKHMKYAEAWNMKVCVEDDVLPNGVKIKKGEFFQWSPWTMGRDTSIWGADAMEFNPERWLQGDKFSPTKFPAFHAGPRTCLGQQFATIEAITLMSLLFKRFDFELVDPDNEPGYGPGLTLPVAKGLPVRIHRRDQSTPATAFLPFENAGMVGVFAMEDEKEFKLFCVASTHALCARRFGSMRLAQLAALLDEARKEIEEYDADMPLI
ncbi:hypothetical protein BGX28_005986 [Mortierella sp. GBA30]|nr:hypothetical protein BGX28_005986 [Mortierella sp. GBA30]